MAKKAEPSRVAAALQYLQQMRDRAADFGGGVVDTLADRARDVGGLAYEAFTSDPNIGRMTTAEYAQAAAARAPTPRLDATAQGVGALGKALVTQPVQTAKAVVVDPIVEAFESPRSMGQFAGEFVNPLRIAAALQKGGTMRRDIFIGKSAKTWDAEAAKRAEEMEAAGTDVGTIWRETGTFRAPDGQWRQEISDADTVFLGEKGVFGGYRLPSGDYPKTPLDLLPHEKLKEAYPDIENVRISQPQKLPGQPDVGQRGSYAPPRKQKSGEFNTEMISMHDYERATPQDLRTTLIHELQHAVQEREPGFTQGSSPTQFRKRQGPQQAVMLLNEIQRYKVPPGEAIRRFERAYERRPDIDAISLMNAVLEKKLTRERLDALNLEPYEQYRRAGGEAEARAVEARINLTPEERKKKFPLQSYDVPIDEIHHPMRR
jgi:hypothetical protein